jgi:serine O-acetyltransferase
MQLNKQQFKEYITADTEARGQKLGLVGFMKDPITRFHWYLRSLEFLQGKKVYIVLFILLKFLFLRLSQRLGFSIPVNTLGKGVYLPHWGTIVVNSKAFVGDYSVINVDVVIGRHPTDKHFVPEIGRSVYIAPGVKVFGGISIGDFSIIGANSVVTKTFQARQLLVGIPAQSLKEVTDEMLNDYKLKLD